MTQEATHKRLLRIRHDIELTMNCELLIDQDRAQDGGRYFVQIKCYRKDVITGEWDYGYGGKGYVDERMSDGQIVQMILGLFIGYWTHEAREGFKWRGRRIFGPHIDINALWEASRHVDIPSAMHAGDRDA